MSEHQAITAGVSTTRASFSGNGDGDRRAFVLAFPLAKRPEEITLNGAPQIAGIKGIDSGCDWYFAIGDAVLMQGEDRTTLTDEDVLEVWYEGQFPTIALT